jgi:hypothetical protein
MPTVARFKGNVAIRLKSNYCFFFVIMCWNIQYLYECIAIYLPLIYSFKNRFALYSGKYCIPAYSREQYGTKQCLLSFTWLSSIPPTAIWNANPGSGKRLLSKSSRPALGPNRPPTRFFLWIKGAGMWSLPIISIYCRGYEWVELHLYYPYTSSWRGKEHL